MHTEERRKSAAWVRAKGLLTEFVLIPAFMMQMAVGCASKTEPPSPTYLTREILPPKSAGKPDIKFTIAPRNDEFAKLTTDAKRKPAGTVRVRFDLDETGTASDVKTKIVGESADPSEARRLEEAASYLFKNSLKISATLDGRPVAAKGVETVVSFDRVSGAQALENGAAAQEDKTGQTVGRAVLLAVGIIILVPIAVLSGGHMSFGK